MLLALDVGNSNTSIGVFEGDQLRCELRLETRRNWTRDEVAILLERALALQGYGFAAISASVIACVVPSALGPLVDGLERYVQTEVLVVGPGVKTGMPVLYDSPKDVGADRIVAAIAAHEIHARPSASEQPGAVIVVDFGTATTFDAITSKGEYAGGAIVPGIEISLDALYARAARLFRVELTEPRRVIGKTTVESIQSGAIYGYSALVDGLVRRMEDELGPSTVVATGGLAGVIGPLCSTIHHLVPELTLTGLRVIFEKNT